jgi:hypothetical protein
MHNVCKQSPKTAKIRPIRIQSYDHELQRRRRKIYSATNSLVRF